MGHTSAALYDLQVELLFGGTADAMRRRVTELDLGHVVRDQNRGVYGIGR